ncbi:MAG: sporulation protein YqfD [Clostridia bacterium]|nr:sporulation protein YqfD [Clostridia bacterium]
MWKNKKGRKGLKVYSLFRVRGVNLDLFVHNLVRKMEVYDVKKAKDGKSITIGVLNSDIEKFFAISNDLCYNDIVRVKEYGIALPIKYLVSNIGLVIGAVFFCLIAIYFNSFIFKFSFTGTGSVIKREITDCLREEGIKTFSSIKKVDLAKLSDTILRENPRLTFVEVRKIGHTLQIDSSLSQNENRSIFCTADSLISDCEGEIIELKVYRGTAVKNVGDYVKKGDILVEGFMSIKDTTISTKVLCMAVIKSKFTCEFILDNEISEEQALIFAENELSDKDVLESVVLKEKTGDKFTYKVNVYYKNILYSN